MEESEKAAGPPGQGTPLVLRAWQEAALPVVIGELKDRKRPIVAAIMGAGKSVLIAALIQRSREQEGRGVIVLAPRTSLVEQLAGTFGNVLGAVNVGQWWEAEKQADRRVTVSTYQSLPTLVEAWRKLGRTCALLVCDEAHRTEAAVILEAVGSLETLAPGRWLARIGVTATPFRSDDRERLSLWDSPSVRYGYGDAVRDGVLVPLRLVGWSGRGDGDDVDSVCVAMLKEADRWPALANAATVEDADAFAERLACDGIRAAAVHSGLSRRVQVERIAALRSGAVQCLVHVSMLAEGTDYPWLRTLLLRRAVGARVRFIQEVGRVLRVDPANPGKVDGLVLDPLDLMGLHGMRAADGLVVEDFGDEAAAEAREAATRAAAQSGRRKAVEVVPVGQWLWAVCSQLEDHGLDLRIDTAAGTMATPKQVATIGRAMSALRWFPADKAKERLRKWQKAGRWGELTRQEASMLIGLMFWLRDQTRPAVQIGIGGDWGAASRMWSARWASFGVTVPTAVPGLPLDLR